MIYGLSGKVDLVVVGSAALDSVRSSAGEVADALGGSAVYFSIAAGLLCKVGMVAVVGGYEAKVDFRPAGNDLAISYYFPENCMSVVYTRVTEAAGKQNFVAFLWFCRDSGDEKVLG